MKHVAFVIRPLSLESFQLEVFEPYLVSFMAEKCDQVRFGEVDATLRLRKLGDLKSDFILRV